MYSHISECFPDSSEIKFQPLIYYIVVDIQKLLKIIKEDDEKVSTN